MRPIAIALAGAFLALGIAAGAGAQGRHDEKPHGVTKAVPDAGKQTRQAATGGRHDEGGTTHGKKRPSKKSADTPPDAATAK